MSLATIPGPTTAERIRSACARAGGAILALEGTEPETTAVHHLLADGSFAITVPARGYAGGQRGRLGRCRRPGGAGDDGLRAAAAA